MLCHTWYFLFINFQMRAAFFYSRAKLFITIRFGGGAYVVVRFCPWFKFYFLLFLGIVMYGNDFESKENKIWTRDKIEPQNLFTVNCELKLWTVSFHLSPWSAFGSLILNCVIQRRFDKINVILLSLNFHVQRFALIGLRKLWDSLTFGMIILLSFFIPSMSKSTLHVTWNIYTDQRSERKYNDTTHFLLQWITFLHDDLRGIASEHLNMLLECECSLR